MEDFETYRSLLFSIAYRMTGSASDADDIVQDAYLRYHTAHSDQIASLKSYLCTIVTNLCLDYLKSARVTREQYPGPWLPEPVLTTAAEIRPPLETLEQRESISLAFLVLLETLTPPERAVFLLHEIFDYPFHEIAKMIGKSTDNCRQMFHRSRLHIANRKPRYVSSQESQQRLLEHFLVACQTGDLPALNALLTDDIVSWSDGGGKVSAALRPIVGRVAVARLYLSIARKLVPAISYTLDEINGEQAILLWKSDRLLFVVALQSSNERIDEVRFILNPDKLAYLQRQLAVRG